MILPFHWRLNAKPAIVLRYLTWPRFPLAAPDVGCSAKTCMYMYMYLYQNRSGIGGAEGKDGHEERDEARVSWSPRHHCTGLTCVQTLCLSHSVHLNPSSAVSSFRVIRNNEGDTCIASSGLHPHQIAVFHRDHIQLTICHPTS